MNATRLLQFIASRLTGKRLDWTLVGIAFLLAALLLLLVIQPQIVGMPLGEIVMSVLSSVVQIAAILVVAEVMSQFMPERLLDLGIEFGAARGGAWRDDRRGWHLRR